jgi:hypothetical protein
MKLEYIGGGRFRVLEGYYTGFETDLASIPRILTPIFPIVGDSIVPSIKHDWNYLHGAQYHGYSRKDADRLFYHALIGYGNPKWRAKLMYWGVRLFGATHWKGGEE